MSAEIRIQGYNLHGLTIAVRTELPEVIPPIHARLRHFHADDSAEHHVVFDYLHAASEKIPVESSEDGWREVYQPVHGRVLYHPVRDQLFMECEGLTAVCHLKTGRTQVWLPNGPPALWLASHPFFALPLFECAKRRGMYNLHAAGLTWNGKNLMIAGTSGAGKSTLTVALVRAGFGFMGDDTLFLTKRPDGLRILGLLDEIDLTDSTVRMFPELLFLLDSPAESGWPKRQLLVERVYDVDIVKEAAPGLILFPRVAHTRQSTITPMTEGEAFMDLAQSVLLTEKQSSQQHLNVVGELVRQCRSYRLETGEDLDAIPDLLRSLL